MKKENFEQKKKRILREMTQKEMLAEILILAKQAKRLLTSKS